MSSVKPILAIDDDTQLLRILSSVLKEQGFEVEEATTGRRGLQLLTDIQPSVLLLDLNLPDLDGLDILKQVVRSGAPVSVIVLTAHGTVDRAVEAMRYGAYDFLTKPLDMTRLRFAVQNAIERQRMIAQLDESRLDRDVEFFHGLAGGSPVMRHFFLELSRAAEGNSPVCFLSNPGVEQEEAARAIHSLRGAGRFLSWDEIDPNEPKNVSSDDVVYCANVDQFSEEASNTLANFLKTPGKGKVIASASTEFPNQAGQVETNAHLFRLLSVHTISIPPLDARGLDVLFLADSFIKNLAAEEDRPAPRLAEEAQEILLAYSWPGNLEELASVMRHVLRQSEGPQVLPRDFPKPLREATSSALSTADAPDHAARQTIKPLWEVEKKAIEDALQFTKGNVVEAARLLEITPMRIYRKLRSTQ